ncbi:MAG: aldolase/citrate lyase family protein [bacterium]
MCGQDERFFDKEQISLRRELQSLIQTDGICTMKLSTEDAGMPFDDILERHRLFGDLLPIQLKIGGPEARNDMRTGVAIGCRSLIAPMIESPYSLRNFLEACQETLGPERFSYIDKQINIETIQGANQIENILSCPQAKQLVQITIGRHDLCRSMKKKPNHPLVLKTIKNIVDCARKHSLKTSVGGRITPGDAEMIARDIKPDKINTREVGFNVSTPQLAGKITSRIIDFEVKLLEHERSFYLREEERLSERITKLRGRHNR